MGDRVWTVDEANAALSRVAALVERATLARGNGHLTGDRGGHAETALREVLGELEEEGIVLRDVDQGLVDFPARSPSGRPYLLCWVVGEAEVGWWHWPEDGFAGRTPLSEPPA